MALVLSLFNQAASWADKGIFIFIGMKVSLQYSLNSNISLHTKTIQSVYVHPHTLSSIFIIPNYEVLIFQIAPYQDIFRLAVADKFNFVR